MVLPRSSGILLHPTSLPGRYGIGDLGEWAYRFVDWLESAGQSVWQILPLGPTSYGDSPYQTLSAFAGNPMLISLDKLVGQKWLTEDDLADVPDFPAHVVDYGPVIQYHNQLLHTAYERFKAAGTAAQQKQFNDWCAENASWLDDFSLFATLKNSHGGRPWVEWPEGEALRDPETLEKARSARADEIKEQRFRQWVFHEQWYAIKTYANDKGIRLIGDIPFVIAHDSADVWANRDRFYLDEKGMPTVVAGVPPDYFAETGQLWGNPLYNWAAMRKTGYRWWIDRIKTTLSQVDMMRIDHFRGFEAYWEIPAEEETAINGKWTKGPGADFFQAVVAQLGELPIIAEDLGVITPEVEALRDQFGLPGMKVLQFAWSDPKNPFLPHQHVENAVVYTGTHDNNTTIGWWQSEVDEGAHEFMHDYLDRDIQEINWAMIRLGMMSVAHTFVAPMQDILGLGPEGRMNTPGKEQGNWTWRFTPDALEHWGKERLGHFTWLYRRRPDQRENEYGDSAVR